MARGDPSAPDQPLNTGMQWERVDFDRGLLRLPDSKTGQKVIVLNAPALAVLSSLSRIGIYVIASESAGTPDQQPR